MPLKKYRTLPALKVNPGIRAEYRKAMQTLFREMAENVVDSVLEEYDRLEWRIVPKGAQDAKWRSPAQALIDQENLLMKKWAARYRSAAPYIARVMLNALKRRVQNQRKKALRDLGITIKPEPSRVFNDKMQALLLENVRLITTLPEDFMSSIQGAVSRSVASGLDRASLAKELRSMYGPSSKWDKHAKLVARDQTSKAVQTMSMQMDMDMGVTEGIWIHVPGTFSSRPTHVAMRGEKFQLKEGIYDPAVKRKVFPGSEICCRCTYRPIFPDNWVAG